MFTVDSTATAHERKSARRELRMRPSDDARIRAAAAAVGLSDADFMTQAALLYAAEIEQRTTRSVLSIERFDAFRQAVEAPGRVIPGLAAALRDSAGILKDG